MTPELIEAVAEAITEAGYAHTNGDLHYLQALAALDAIKAAGFVIRPRGVKMVEREPFYFVEVPETD